MCSVGGAQFLLKTKPSLCQTSSSKRKIVVFTIMTMSIYQDLDFQKLVEFAACTLYFIHFWWLTLHVHTTNYDAEQNKLWLVALNIGQAASWPVLSQLKLWWSPNPLPSVWRSGYARVCLGGFKEEEDQYSLWLGFDGSIRNHKRAYYIVG